MSSYLLQRYDTARPNVAPVMVPIAPMSSPCAMKMAVTLRALERDESVGRVELEQSETEDARDTQAAPRRRHAERRQPPFGRREEDGIADTDAEMLRQILAEDDAVERDAVGAGGGRTGNGVEAAGLHRPGGVGNARFERRIDPLDGDEVFAARGADDRLAQNAGRNTRDMRHRAKFLHVGAIVVEAAWLAYIDVGLAPENLVAECVLQARHHGQRDDGRHHADGDADGRDERDDGDEGLLPP